MNGPGVIFLTLCGAALLALPRQWVAVPVLLSIFFMTQGQALDVAGANFTVVRIVLVVGLIRIIARREIILSEPQAIEWAALAWAAAAILICGFRKDASDALKFNLGMIMDAFCSFLMFRSAYRTPEEIRRCCWILGVILLFFVLPIVYERKTGSNPFAIFTGVADVSAERDGKIRACGAFQSYITAGTAGATSIPLLVALFVRYRPMAMIGVLSALIIVYCSNSSGPIMAAIAAGFALWMWKRRVYLPALRVATVVMLILLEIVMKSHVWYLMAKIDITSGNNGYHRAELITQAFRHLREWWLCGTTYTRHWMETGVSWSPDHCDITDYYIKMGVIGGLPVMIGLIAVIWAGFSVLGKYLRSIALDLGWTDNYDSFLAWCLGSTLFCHAVTFISVSYYDQTSNLFWMCLGLIAALGRSGQAQKWEGATPA